MNSTLSDGLIPFTNEHYMVQGTIRQLVDDVIAPRAAELDETHEFPLDNFRALAELDLLGIFVPEEYGGAGMDFVCYAIAMEELARGCASTALTLAAHASLCMGPLLLLGSEEQKRRWLPGLCRGEQIGCFGLSEPHAGSDAGDTRTLAVRDGEDYVVSGTKMWITNGRQADVMVATVKTDPDQPRGHGISALVIDMHSPGVSVPKTEDKLGMRASSTAQVFLDNVRVPVVNRLGVENDGFKTFMKTLENGRIGIGALALGIARAAYERAVRYATQRETFGRPLAGHQTIQGYIANMATELEAARLLVYRAAFMRAFGGTGVIARDGGTSEGAGATEFGREAAMAKLYASEAAMRITERAIQIHGGFGYVREFEVERYWRDAKLTTIGEGATEILQIVIARDILGQASRSA